ncbi:MAG: MFS transporter [Acidimicrobiia bacterium]
MTRDQAPFISPSPGARPLPASPWRVFGTRAFFKLWVAQCLSSLGDWVGFFAILAIATRISGGSATAVSLVVGVRMVPGFFLAPVGGVIVDRFDRRKVMVVCDVGRAVLLVLLPFIDGLLGLVIISFSLELFTLLWGPAKDASLPNLVPDEQLAAANSLGLVAAYGTFPIAAAVSSALAVLAHWLGGFDALSALEVNREALALWVDGLSFLASAVLIWGLPLPKPERKSGRRVDWTQTFREIVEGLRFIRSDRLVRAVMIGMAGGIIGAGAMVPLGAVFAEDVLGGTSQFFVLMTGLGTGLAIGVATLLAVQKKVPRDTVFTTAVMGVGVFLLVAACFDNILLAVLSIAAVGGFAGTAYITGFTLLQENVADELRGRTFATLYTIVRLCLLVSLTISPLFADLFDWLTEVVLGPDRTATIAGVSYAVPGVRVALWGGGLVTLASGVLARFLVRRARRARSAAEATPS